MTSMSIKDGIYFHYIMKSVAHTAKTALKIPFQEAYRLVETKFVDLSKKMYKGPIKILVTVHFTHSSVKD